MIAVHPSFSVTDPKGFSQSIQGHICKQNPFLLGHLLQRKPLGSGLSSCGSFSPSWH
jgi:hypothetical protein